MLLTIGLHAKDCVIAERVQPESTITHRNWEWIIFLFEYECTCTCTSCSKLYPNPTYTLKNAKRWPPICWITCTTGICSWVSIGTHWHLSWHYTLTSWSRVGWKSTNFGFFHEGVNKRLTINWLLIKCQPSVDQVLSIVYWQRCRLRVLIKSFDWHWTTDNNCMLTTACLDYSLLTTEWIASW